MTMPAQTHLDCGTDVAESNKPPLDRQALIDGLKHAYCREVRDLYQQEIADEHGHAPFLSYKIATWEGEPTAEPGPVVPYVNQPREMLEHALATAE